MKIFSTLCVLATFTTSVLLPFNSLCADPTKNSTAQIPVKSSVLEASAQAALSWLNLVDKGRYPESWNESSVIMKMTMPKDEWVQILDKTRKSLGSLTSRQMLDQRTAKNPHGLPAGDYMVMFYKTAFSEKKEVHELVTLFLEDGEWRVLTYQVN